MEIHKSLRINRDRISAEKKMDYVQRGDLEAGGGGRVVGSATKLGEPRLGAETNSTINACMMIIRLTTLEIDGAVCPRVQIWQCSECPLTT